MTEVKGECNTASRGVCVPGHLIIQACVCVWQWICESWHCDFMTAEHKLDG